MKIKVATTPEQRESIEANLKRYTKGFLSLKEKYEKDVRGLERKIEDYKKFWETNEIPIYTTDYNRPYNPDKLHEAKSIWKEMGLSITAMKMQGVWVCDKCEQPIGKKYIATGHDHTDYSYDVCDCEGVQGNKRYHELI